MCGLCEGFPDYKDGGALALNERLTLREHILWTNFETLSPRATGLVLGHDVMGDDARGQHFLPADYFTSRTDDSGTTAAIGTIFTPSLSGNQAVDALLAGTAWTMSTINYAFPTSPSDYPSNYGDGEPQNNFEMATLEFQQAIRYILEGTTSVEGGYRFVYGSVESFTLVDFVETSASQAIIKVASSADPGTAWGYYPWTDEEGGDVWFNNAYAGSRSVSYPQIGDYNWHTAIHELGHALGLKHGHETDGLTGFPVPAFMDSLEYTVMTYRSYVGGSTSGGYTNETWGFPQTFMMLDIAALQQMYGADFTVNSTDTTYTWNPNTGEMSLNGVGQGAPGGNRIFLTIWDGGGIDTYDFSNYTSGPVTVDLSPGGYSIASEAQLANLGNSNFARGNIFNALLFQGDTRSLIENAIGTFWGDQITGNQANNRLEGRENFDNLNGAGGNDTIIGGADNDFLNGGSGNDVFVFNAGDAQDTIGDFKANGDADKIQVFGYTSYSLVQEGVNTRVIFSASDSIVLMNTVMGTITAADFIFGNAGPNVINGTSGRDTLDGTSGVDEINGLADNDVLDGKAGDDVMAGGLGDDTFYVDAAGDQVIELAGEGFDLVYASVSYTLAAGVSVEVLSAWQQDATTAINLTGNELANTVYGNFGVNTLTGLAGADTLLGLAGNDTLLGGDNNDVLIGGAGNDVMNGGAGDDVIFVDDAGDSIVEAIGGGNDLIYASVNFTLTAGAEVEVIATSNQGGTAGLALTGNELANIIYGDAGSNTLSGAAGDDILLGLLGADTLNGGDGADILIGGAGNDVMNGGLGDDAFFVDDAGDVVNEASGQGADAIYASVSYTLAAGSHVEVLSTQDQSAVTALNMTGNELANIVYGNGGTNTLSGLGGADILLGLAGNDILNGGDGDDIILGGLGNDQMNGGAGNDAFFVDDAGDTVAEALGQGGDVIYASISYALAAGQEIEVLSTRDQAASTAINLTGNELNNTLYGNQGVNTLSGGAGLDILLGLGGNDILEGGAGNDFLFGGTGADTFRYASTATGDDFIQDFTDGQDLIQLTAATGADDFSDLVVTANGSGWAQITLPDGSTITLTGITTAQVSSADFVFGP